MRTVYAIVFVLIGLTAVCYAQTTRQFCPTLEQLCNQYPDRDYFVITILSGAGGEPYSQSYWRYREYYEYYINANGNSQPLPFGFRVLLIQARDQPAQTTLFPGAVEYTTASPAGCVESINIDDSEYDTLALPSNISDSAFRIRGVNSTFMPNSVEAAAFLTNGGLLDYFFNDARVNLTGREPYPTATFLNTVFNRTMFAERNGQGALPVDYYRFTQGFTNFSAIEGPCSEFISVSPSVTPSISVTASTTASLSASASITPSGSVSLSATSSASLSSTSTASLSASVSLSASISFSPSSTTSLTSTPSLSPSPTTIPLPSFSNSPAVSASGPSSTVSASSLSFTFSSSTSFSASRSPATASASPSTSAQSRSPSISASRNASTSRSASRTPSISVSRNPSRSSNPSRTASNTKAPSRSSNPSPSRSPPPSRPPTPSRRPTCPQTGKGYLDDFYGANFNLGPLPVFTISRDDNNPDVVSTIPSLLYWENGASSHVKFSWHVASGKVSLSFTGSRFVQAGSIEYDFRADSVVGDTVVVYCSAIATLKVQLKNVVINGVGGRICDLGISFGNLLGALGVRGVYNGDLTPSREGFVTVEADVDFTWFGGILPSAIAQCGIQIERVSA